MKNIFVTINVLGFCLLLLTVGASDFGMETGRQLLTNYQFLLQLGIGLLMFMGGEVGISLFTREIKTEKSHTKLNKMKIHKLSEQQYRCDIGDQQKTYLN